MIDETAKAILAWSATDTISYQSDHFNAAGQIPVADLQAMARFWLMKSEIQTFVTNVCRVDRTAYSDVEDVQRSSDTLLAKLDALTPLAPKTPRVWRESGSFLVE